MSQALMDMALGAEPKRVILGALSNAAGKPMRFKAVSGGSASSANGAAASGQWSVGQRSWSA